MRRSSLETSADSRLLGATLNNFLFGPRSHNAALFVFLIEYVLYPRKERVRPELRMHNPKKNTTKAAPARRGEQESLTTNKQKKKRWELLRQYTTVSSNSRSPENILTLLFFSPSFRTSHRLRLVSYICLVSVPAGFLSVRRRSLRRVSVFCFLFCPFNPSL